LNARRARGFTLVEIVVVLAIAGLAAAVAVPALGSVLRADSSPSAPVAELLDKARRSAMERERRVTVVVSPETGRYWVWADTLNGRTSLASGILALGNGATFERTQPRLTVAFDALGAASGDTLVVRTAQGTDLVTADRWTGEVHAIRR
jgi:prepilin-type N-terminal cleavage/methylation domain-containing protein